MAADAAAQGVDPQHNWLDSLAAEFLDDQNSFEFLPDGADPFAADPLLLPPLTFPTSSDESTPGQGVRLSD